MSLTEVETHSHTITQVCFYTFTVHEMKHKAYGIKWTGICVRQAICS